MPKFRLIYHLIWTTDNRLPLINSRIEGALFDFIKQKAIKIECNLITINGTEDHIHLVIEIPPKLSVSDAVKILKGSSSYHFPDLYWSKSYGVFSLSGKNLKQICEYVNNQKLHHGNYQTIDHLEQI